MRILSKALIAASIPALAVAAPAFAQSSGGGQMNGQVQPVCAVSDVFAAQSFSSMTQGQTLNDDITLTCNDFDGAEITLISSEGGMESDDVEDLEIEYTAEVVANSVTLVSLSTGPTKGNNDVQASGLIAGSSALASGLAANLTVTLDDSASWAGGYSDTITVQLTAQ